MLKSLRNFSILIAKVIMMKDKEVVSEGGAALLPTHVQVVLLLHLSTSAADKQCEATFPNFAHSRSRGERRLGRGWNVAVHARVTQFLHRYYDDCVIF